MSSETQSNSRNQVTHTSTDQLSQRTGGINGKAANLPFQPPRAPVIDKERQELQGEDHQHCASRDYCSSSSDGGSRIVSESSNINTNGIRHKKCSSSEQNHSICGICLDKIIVLAVTDLSCQHNYWYSVLRGLLKAITDFASFKCLFSWIHINNSCPLCKGKITKVSF